MSGTRTAPFPCNNPTRPGGKPARSVAAIRRAAVSGVFSDGFRMTGFPAAMAGATLCRTVFRGELNGVIARTGPTGTRIVHPVRPAPDDQPAKGMTSPTRLRAASDESFRVSIARENSPSASAVVKPVSAMIVATRPCRSATISRHKASMSVARANGGKPGAA